MRRAGRRSAAATPIYPRDLIDDAVTWVAEASSPAATWRVAMAAALLHTVVDPLPAERLVEAGYPNGPGALEAMEIVDVLTALDVPPPVQLTHVDPLVHSPVQVWKPSPFAARMYAVDHTVLRIEDLRPARDALIDVLACDEDDAGSLESTAAEPTGPDAEGGIRWMVSTGPYRDHEIVVWQENDERLGFVWTGVHAVPTVGRDYGPPIIEVPLLAQRTAVQAALMVVESRLAPTDLRDRRDVLPGWSL